MSASSSIRSSVLRRPSPYIPLVPCSDCGATVKRSCSGTKEHDGWMYYKCRKHGKGCNFWHWELQYVEYLVENNILRGDEAVDAIGWAEDRREELQLRKAEREATRPGSGEMMMNKMSTMVELLTEAVLLLKVVVGLVAIICLTVLQRK